MDVCDTLISARWCVPVDHADTVLEHHSIAISDGRIIDVLPSDAARTRYRSDRDCDLPTHVLLPGLVNTHTHAAMTLFRGIADDLPLEAWLRDVIWPLESRSVGPEMVRDGTRLAIAEMILAGCTTYSDQYFFPEISAECAADMHMRAVIGTPVIDFATPWANDASECLRKGADLVHDRYADHALVSSCFAPHSTISVSNDSLSELRVMADQLDAPIQMHLHESTAELETSIQQCGNQPIQHLDDLGLLNSSLLAVHAVHLNDVEIDQLAEAGVCVSHCPTSNLKLADGIAPVTRLQQAGVTVGLGSDSAASNNRLDIMAEMRLATLLARVDANDATAMPAAAAVRMATLDGAAALGLQSSIGSLEVGKRADIIAVDLSPPRSQPVYDAVSQLVHAAGASQVSDVWIDGRQQVTKGELTGIDLNDILRRAHEWPERLQQ